jgi:hypothetical protein
LKCNNCKFAGLFHCAHPQKYITSFLDICDLYKKGKDTIIFDNTVICDSCKKKVHINDVKTFNKGSKFICMECLEKTYDA